MANANIPENVKQPQDHKAPADELKTETNFFELEGHELLKPPGKLSLANRVRFIGTAQAAGLTHDEGDDSAPSEVDMLAFAEIIEFLAERCAVDQEQFEAATTKMGLEKSLELVGAYITEVGNVIA